MEEKEDPPRDPTGSELRTTPIKKQISEQKFEEHKDSYLFEPALVSHWMSYLPDQTIAKTTAYTIPLLDRIFRLADIQGMTDDEILQMYDDNAYNPNSVFTVFYTDGVIDREDGPAIYNDQLSVWVKNGEIFRENNLPPVVWHDGFLEILEWWSNGNLHRDNDQPAVIWEDGTREWWVNGQRHRGNDQPAVVWDDGGQEWWMNGMRHREGDLPAIVEANGVQEWWFNNELHREGGPARIGKNGVIHIWYHHGLKHRLDGPAVIRQVSDGHFVLEWWINGVQVRRETVWVSEP